VLDTLGSQFRDLDALEGHLNSLLAKLIPQGVRKRGRRVAIDVVALPYHDTVDEAHQGEVCRTKPREVRRIFSPMPLPTPWSGASLHAGAVRIRAKQRMDYVLRTLLARLATLGIRIKLLLLDRGFYSVRVLQDLMTCRLPFIMPAVKRGKQSTTVGGPTGTYALAAEKHSHWTTYTATAPQQKVSILQCRTRGAVALKMDAHEPCAVLSLQPRPGRLDRELRQARERYG
jgi:putative transposase